MIKYKYKVVYSNKFKKALRNSIKQGKNVDKLEPIILKLANKEKLEHKYKNHNLVNSQEYQNCKECHIEPDWLLVYKYVDDELILLLMNTGSHSEIFK